MKVHRAHKIRLRPNNKQASYFAQACGCARFAYNWALSEWKREYEAGKKPNTNALRKKFNAIKRDQFPFVTKVTKCAPARAFTDLDAAFKRFFRNVKTGKKSGYPRFKRRGIRDSFYLSNEQFKLDGKQVRIPKLGWVKMREALRFDGKIMSAVVSKTADMWFISIHVEMEMSDVVSIGPIIGVDVGIKTLATISDGRTFANPKALKARLSRLRLLQKSVSRKKKGSNNRRKAALKLHRQYYRVSSIRKDVIHKMTSAITKGVSKIVIEDLHVKGMLKNRKLSKALSDVSLGEVHRQIEYKSRLHGVVIVKADRFFPSSKTCSSCGVVKNDLSLKDRAYNCSLCGLEIDRDINAAINLKHLAAGSAVTVYRLGSSGRTPGCGETTDRIGSSQGCISMDPIRRMEQEIYG